jgi:amyloid beta precursor protein binding protein 1
MASNQTTQQTEQQRDKRYDRQIRIWGKSGQERLETASVCLLGAGPSGSEAMKNLVLGGVSSYTIVDGKKVTARDFGNNFLIDAESMGQSRAECCSRLLQEFNESVSGRYIAESPEELIDGKAEFFEGFSLILATQLTEPYQMKLDRICRARGVQVIFGRSYGLFGLVRICKEEHAVIEAKPENVLQNLRVHDPWLALRDYAHQFDLESLDNMTYKHVPYVVILIKALRLWSQAHDNKAAPSTRQEQKDFKQFLRSLQRKANEDGFLDEGENFKEAVENAHYLWSPPRMPSELKQYFESDSCCNLTENSTKFWVLVAALKRFVSEGDGNLPFPGSIPDMTATTDLYLELKRIYTSKAEEDVSKMAAHVREILEALKREQKEVSLDDVKLFCKNSSHLKVLKYSSIEKECQSLFGAGGSAYFQSLLFSEDSAENAFVYVLFHAADKFFAKHGHFPGSFDEGMQEDIGSLKSIVNATLSEAGLSSVPISEEYIHEVCRCGAGEIHTVAAVVGGVLAEEAIKLITEQFVPLKGTLVYNGIRSTTLRVLDTA